jgi:hypothetical protein
MIFLLTVGIGFGTYLGVRFASVFQSAVESVRNVHETMQKTEQLHNTVLPAALDQWIPSQWLSWLETGKFFATFLYTEVEQWLTGSCTPHLDTNLYRVAFTIQNKLYYVLVRPELGPGLETTFHDSEGNDLTLKIAPFLRGTASIISDLTPQLLLGTSEAIQCNHDDLVRHLEATDLFYKKK